MSYRPEVLDAVGHAIQEKLPPGTGVICFIGEVDAGLSSWTYISNLSPDSVVEAVKAFAGEGMLAVVEGSEKGDQTQALKWRPGHKNKRRGKN